MNALVLIIDSLYEQCISSKHVREIYLELFSLITKTADFGIVRCDRSLKI